MSQHPSETLATSEPRRLSSREAAIGAILTRMNLDFRRPPDDPETWLDSIASWNRALLEIPDKDFEQWLQASYEAALGARDDDRSLITVIEIRTQFRRLRSDYAREQAASGRTAPTLANKVYVECTKCHRTGYAQPPVSASFLCPLCREGGEVRARFTAAHPHTPGAPQQGFRAASDIAPKAAPSQDGPDDGSPF